MSANADVLVVEAGLAGLTAARDLVRAGRSALVLEVRNRIGGRIVSQPIGDGKMAEMAACRPGRPRTAFSPWPLDSHAAARSAV
jgi:monoamine oxidase